MNLSKGWKRYRAAMALLSIPLDEPGELRFEVKLNGKSGAVHVVNVHDTETLSAREESKIIKAD